MRWLLLILIFFLQACGRGTIDSPSNHGVFEPYFQAFEEESIAHGRDTTGDTGISIQFVDSLSMETNELGQCDKSMGRSVSILRSGWGKASEVERTLLIAHELGHCLLNRQHRNDTYNIFIPLTFMDPVAPVSIMHPSLPTEEDFHYAEAKYWDELFNDD